MVPGTSQDGMETALMVLRHTTSGSCSHSWEQVWKHTPFLGVSKCSSNQTFTVPTFVKLGHSLLLRNFFPFLSGNAHLQQQILICICPTCLEFSQFAQATSPLLLASNISRMQEEQTPYRQNLTHCCVLIAMFDVPGFFTDFLIICCLQVHLVSSGRWWGLVGSLLASVSNIWRISWCAGSHLRAFKGYGKIHLRLMLFKSQQFNVTLWAEIFK